MVLQIVGMFGRLRGDVEVLPNCRIVDVEPYLLEALDKIGGSCGIVDHDLQPQSYRRPWQSSMSRIIIHSYVSYLNELLNPRDKLAKLCPKIDLPAPCCDLPFRGCMLPSCFDRGFKIIETEG